jgi:hypothetical protein
MTGCLYQIYEISVIYFSYETTTDVRYEDEVMIELPAFTFCVPKVFMARIEYLKQSTNKSTKTLEDMHKYLNKLTLKEQFKALYSAEELFYESCFVKRTYALNNSEKYVDCHLVSEVKIIINNDNLCVRLFSQMNGESDDKYRIDYDFSISSFNEHIVDIQFSSYLPLICLNINSKKEFIRNLEEKNSLLLYYEKSKDFMLSIKEQTFS